MKNRSYVSGSLVVIFMLFISTMIMAVEEEEETLRLLAETYVASGQHQKAINVYEVSSLKIRMTLTRGALWPRF